MTNTNDLKTFIEKPFGASKGSLQFSSFQDDDTAFNTFVTAGKTLSKPVQIINAETGAPLVNVHITSNGKGQVTNQNGEAVLQADYPGQSFTISHVGFRTHIATFENLGGLISLQINVNSLPPVVVNPKPPVSPILPNPEANKTLLYGAIGAAAIFAISALLSKPKKATKKRRTVTV